MVGKTCFFHLPERTRVNTANLGGKCYECAVAKGGFDCLYWARLNQLIDKMADSQKLVRQCSSKDIDSYGSSDSSLGLDNASSDDYHPSTSDESSREDKQPPRKARKRIQDTAQGVTTTALDPGVTTTALDPGVTTTAPDPGVDTTAQDPAPVTTPVQPPKKRRKRNYGNPREWKKNIRKEKRIRGETYTSTTGMEVCAKVFTPYNCNCKLSCSEKVTADDTNVFFNLYWKSGSHEAQTAIISQCVRVKKTNRKTSDAQTKREHSREYFIPSNNIDVKVCKTFFLKTLQIDSAKVHRALVKIHSGNIQDKRGRHVPHNKLSADRIEYVKNHINSFPSYQSHYSRRDNPNKKYLGTHLNLSLMYRLYKEKMEDRNLTDDIVSQSIYEKVFYKDFNLSFKPPHKDTCKTCDTFNTRKKAILSEKDSEDKQVSLDAVNAEADLHHRKVQSTQEAMKTDVITAKQGECSVLTFDLQKTFSLPKVPTGVVYYKRQLSVYNLGIHDCETDQGTMYLWNECVGGRGPDDIGSCILKHVGNRPTKQKVILWSDSCGGQNRNFKLVSLLMRLVQDPTNHIQEVVQKFPIPGHSFLPNDTDFGHIEKNMRRHEHIYIPDQIKQIIKSSRVKKKAFEVVEMKASDFITSDSVTAALTNRKKSEHEQVQWLKIRCLKVSKEKPCTMEYKYSHSDLVPYQSVNFKKRHVKTSKKGSPVGTSIFPLHRLVLQIKYPNGRPLPLAKKTDLSSMLGFVPPVYHGFYQNLFSIENTQPTADGNMEDSSEDE